MMPKMHRPASLLLFLITLSLILLACTTALAQEDTPQKTGTQYDRGTAPQHAAGVSSLGSYISADLGTINLSNGSLNFSLPLGSVGGRGFWVPLSLNYSSKVWSAGSGTDTKPDVEPTFPPKKPLSGSVVYAMYDAAADVIDEKYRVAPGWTIGAQPMLKAEIIGINPVPNDCRFYYKLTKLTLVLPDKGEIQLRDDLTNGAPLPVPVGQGCNYRDGNRGQRWHATDGSGIVFVSDDANGVVNGVLNGVVITADGMRYRFASIYSTPPLEPSGLARCTSITDRNGNKVEITYPTVAEVRYTDQLGRVTTVVRQSSQLIVVTVPGYLGQSRTYKIKLGPMNQHFRSDENPGAGVDVITGDLDAELLGRYDHDGPHIELFSSSWGAFKQQIDGRNVVSELELPDGRSLSFKYNKYGEVAEVLLPTGGKVEYDYAHAGSLPSGNTLTWEKQTGAPLISNVSEIDRALVKRRTYPDGSTLEATWSYSYGPQSVAGTSYPSASVTAHSGAGTDAASLLLNQRHYFLNGGRYLGHVNPRSNGTGYSWWSTGIEWRTEIRDANGNIISASEQDWSQRMPVVWTTGYGTEQEQPENDNRMNETRQILNNGLIAKTQTLYDQYNNPIEVKEYDFDATLKRRTVSTYANNSNLINGVDYTSDAIHLLRLPLSQTVYDGAETKRAESLFQYDNYSGDGNNLPLADYATVSGHDALYGPGKFTRGNLTSTGSWLQTPGVAGESYLYTYSRYDILGNVVSLKDARGHVSSISYADDFGDGSLPGNHAQNPVTPTYALPTLITSPAPNPGEAAHTANSQYDYSTGLLTGFRDRNNVVTQTIYADAFNRPTLVKSALGISGVESHSRMYYAPATAHGITLSGNDVLTAADLATLDDEKLRSWTHTDGLGRTIESWKHDPQGDVKVETIYDGLGRQRQVSNPYRPTVQGEVACYTTTAYDLAGRVSSVTTPDSATVQTAYDGDRVLVTDQAGKRRLSRTDGLGRLTDVWEITAADAATISVSFPNQAPMAGYQTHYDYDTLDNLKQVTQGTQQPRTFAYDSLKRLTSAFNPESGAISYAYDESGNLTQKSDARGITTTYTYDALNRITTRTYQNDGGLTPSVYYKYDAQTLPSGAPMFERGPASGRLVAVLYGGTTSVTGSYQGYDAGGRVKRSFQVTHDGQANQTYSFPNYEYDLAGNVKSETYPSGRVITTSYDAVGRLSAVNGQQSGEASKTYISQMSYAASGAVKDAQLGNGLWEQTILNSRLQPTQIKLGTTQGGVERLKLTYTYGTTTNNGNVQSQMISVPTIGTATGFTVTQNYSYDALNRLEWAEEKVEPTQAQVWKQSYAYDRFGNRRIDTGTVQPGDIKRTSDNIAPQAFDNPTLSATDNRIAAGQGYGYDAAGNLTTTPNRFDQSKSYKYEYDAENHQVSLDREPVATPNQKDAIYLYDGDGKRVRKIADGVTTLFVYDVSGQLIAEYSTSGSMGAGTSYLTTDVLGTPRVITGSNINDDNGGVKARHDYLPFGEEVFVGRNSSYASDAVRQKFTQYERDIETGLDYAINRYYSTPQGRFTSPDPYHIIFEKEKGKNRSERRQIFLTYISQVQNWNKYAYTLNNPLKYSDPDGRRPLTAEDQKRLDKLQALHQDAQKAGDKELANAAYNAIVQLKAAIAAVPDGQQDPANLKAALWAVGQLGSNEYSEAASHSNGVTANIGSGSPKCNIFVAEAYAIGAGVGFGANGVPTSATDIGAHLGRWQVPVANTLADLTAEVNNFPTTTTLNIGTIVSFSNPSGASGHTGIHVGGSLIIHAAYNGVKANSLGQLSSRLTQQYGARPSSTTWRIYNRP
jgi:RHS repeat-associated protein